MSYTFEPPFDRPSKRRRGSKSNEQDGDSDNSDSRASTLDSNSSQDESSTQPFLPFDNGPLGPDTIPAGTSKSSGAKWHHINLLNAILHKSLQQRDYDRASRAFGLLLRVEHRGSRLDLRKKGLWEIGATIVENRSVASTSPAAERESSRKDIHDGQRDDGDNEHDTMREAASQNPSQALGANYTNTSEEEQRLASVQRYFNRLIRDYPYVRWRPQNVDERIFYPYLFEASIRETQVRTKNAINAINTAATTSTSSTGAQVQDIPTLPRIALVPPPPDESSRSPTPLSDSSHPPPSPPSASSSPSSGARSSSASRSATLPFIPSDLPITPGTLLALSNVKQHELVAARQISGKIAGLIVSPPYDRHVTLLRLQSMVLTWTADLIGDIESLGRQRDKIREGEKREGVAVWVAGESVGAGTKERKRPRGRMAQGSGDEMDGVESAESSGSASDDESLKTGSTVERSAEEESDEERCDDRAGQSHHLHGRVLNAVDVQLKDFTIDSQDKENARRTAEKIKDLRRQARGLRKRAKRIEKAAASGEEIGTAEDDDDEKGSMDISSAESDSE